MISSHLHLGLFWSGFQIKCAYAFLMLVMRTTCPAHLTLLDLIILTFGET